VSASAASDHAQPGAARRPALRLYARAGAPPVGLVLGTVGVVAGLAVSLLHLDRLPMVFCVFKSLTGLPCPTCGSTRAFGRLFVGDLAGALSMNPLTTLAAASVLAWALADLVLLPRRRALAVELHPRVGQALRVAAVLALLLNWVFLLAARR
jgi:hypothetical protein